MKNDDYNWDGHDFWTHFFFGLVVGAVLGAWISSSIFDSRLAFLGTMTGIAITFAWCCGHWGEAAWRVLFEFLSLLC